MTEKYDLVVVGCGAAGLSAALAFADARSAAQGSARIAVLESAPEAERGGATRWTMAGLRVDETGRLDPAWVGTVQEVSGGLSDLDYCRTLEAEAPTTLSILRDLGLEFHSIMPPVAKAAETGMGPNGGGHAIIEAHVRRLQAFTGVEFHYETEAVELLLSDAGRISGVSVRGSDGLLAKMHSDHVILACGGFEGNPEMLTQYMGRNACDLKLIAPGIAYNKGAGIRMAMKIGAATAGQFDMMHSELVDRRTTRADAVIYGHPYGIVVNGEGRRFYDEGENSFDASFELIAYEVWRNQKQTAFFIADQTVGNNPSILALFDTDLPPVEADTIADLAVQLGLEPDGLEQTVADYNDAVGPGEFDPSIFDGKAALNLSPPKSNWAYPLTQPPYFAYPLTAAVTFTYGGLKTDTDGRVLGTNGRPIPGLFAAGEIVGLFYHQYTPATSVLKALTFGRLSGLRAARSG